MSDFFADVDLLQAAMTANTLRYQVASNNLANAEVPNFKRSDVNFETALKQALESEKAASGFQMKATRPEHFQSSASIDWRTVEPRISVDYATTANANGNNVNAEQEAMNVLKIQMQYQMMAQLQNFNFSQVRMAMK